MRITDFKKFFKIILFILLFGVFCFRFTSGLNFYPLYGDEQDFVARARYFDLFFIKRDFLNKDWQSELAYDHPPIAYYIYGLTLHLKGYNDLAKEQERIGFNVSRLDEAVLGWSIADLPSVLLPSFKMIWQARKAAVVFSLGCLLLIYFLGLEIGGFATGLFSVLILGFNQLMFNTGRRAIADSILLFFFLANVLLIIYTLKFFYKKQALEFLGS
ncbi:hypothetical protein COU95_02480, partial [Candidatus Shapirobacteria bacterium CG10_big_fil_rev_8_21_14_0_10_40_9]